MTGPEVPGGPDVPDIPDVPCVEFVEVVTDYLDGALPDELVAHIDAHLASCAGCRSVLAQWRQVIRLTGRLAGTDVDRIDADTRARLLATFRRHHGT